MANLINFIKKFGWYFIILIICGCIIGVGYKKYFETHSVNKDFASIDLDDYNKVLIVAHPDDELLWGGSHLISDNYLVVCITCGGVQTRVNEFVQLMRETNDRYIMLGYPDKTNGERDNWDGCRDDLKKDLEDILSLKDWEIIVTHNPDGEYGHQHHKMTNELVTDIANREVLYYFGVYHSKKTIAPYLSDMVPISDKNFVEKKRLIGIYRSQNFIQTMFDHMYPYENWVKASDWSYGNEENN